MLGDDAELGCGRHSWEVGLFNIPVAWKDSDVETLDFCYSFNPLCHCK